MALSDNLGGGESYFIVEIKSSNASWMQQRKTGDGCCRCGARSAGMDAAVAQEKKRVQKNLTAGGRYGGQPGASAGHH